MRVIENAQEFFNEDFELEYKFQKYYGQNSNRSEEVTGEQVRSPRIFSIAKSIPLFRDKSRATSYISSRDS